MSNVSQNTAVDPSRAVIRVHGDDAADFLQGLLTNDISKASADTGVYAALLTPQGKYLADMIVTRPAHDQFLIDAASAQADGLVQRLSMYKLRAKVALERDPTLSVVVIWTQDGQPIAPSDGQIADPRDPRLGLRQVTPTPPAAPTDLASYHALRLGLAVPLSGVDLRPNDSYLLENDFERLNGVDFKKGCYVGQEIVARMHHKTQLKKGLRQIKLQGAAEPGAELLKDGKSVGVLGSVEGADALALLRLDRIGDGRLETQDGVQLIVSQPKENL
ncbi:MAG: folate-binding protein [Pseudomonadota bacterium]